MNTEERIKILEETIGIQEEITEIYSTIEFHKFFKRNKNYISILRSGFKVLPVKSVKNKNVTVEFGRHVDLNPNYGGRADVNIFIINGSLGKLKVTVGYTEDEIPVTWKSGDWKEHNKAIQEYLGSSLVSITQEQFRVIKKYDNVPMTIGDFEDALKQIDFYIKKNMS